MKETVALALNIDRFMRRIHTNLHPKAEAVDHARAGPFGGMILMTIAEAEPLSIRKLAKHLGRDKSQMTRALQTLERKELIIRNQSPEDARVTLVSLTEEGHDLVASFHGVMTEVIDHLLVDLSRQERKQFSVTLEKILSGPAKSVMA